MAILLAAIITVLLVLVGVLFVLSPGKARLLTGADGRVISGSISEKTFVDINGVKQGMFIESANPTNPVLLFVHGGPGVPEHFLSERYPTGLEKDFTLVWWEQRGAGMSNSAATPPEAITIEQHIEDTISVTNYLRQRFGKDKIYLMAHSWGSFIGIQAAARRPELYHAYIGMGQVTYQLKSEMLAHVYMLEQYNALGNTSMVRKLEAGVPTLDGPLPIAYDRVRDTAMHTIGIGTTRDMKSIEAGVFLRSWLSPDYTLGEKIRYWRGKFSSRSIRNQAFAIDITQVVTGLDLPVYFFEGAYDYTCSYTLAKDYFDMLDAPLKGFYTFEQSAHSPIFEEPERMRQILREDVAEGANALADGR